MRNYRISYYIVHCKKRDYDVYIGRPSKWGNPFTVGIDGNRKEVIEKYREWIMQQPDLLKDIHELKGKILGCWCTPRRCHGEVLAELANKEEDEIDEDDEENEDDY